MIDPATCWFEIAAIDNKSSIEIANELEITWLTRYPWPTEIVCDRGTEFMSEVQRMLREDYHIKKKMITTRNPQANSIVERAHQSMRYESHFWQIVFFLFQCTSAASDQVEAKPNIGMKSLL